jgi:hypothetical protein
LELRVALFPPVSLESGIAVAAAADMTDSGQDHTGCSKGSSSKAAVSEQLNFER